MVSSLKPGLGDVKDRPMEPVGCKQAKQTLDTKGSESKSQAFDMFIFKLSQPHKLTSLLNRQLILPNADMQIKISRVISHWMNNIYWNSYKMKDPQTFAWRKPKLLQGYLVSKPYSIHE